MIETVVLSERSGNGISAKWSPFVIPAGFLGIHFNKMMDARLKHSGMTGQGLTFFRWSEATKQALCTEQAGASLAMTG
jgi:hypothetical protein